MRSVFLLLLLVLGTTENPFAVPARARVLIFARTDCPITNRYAPEIDRIARRFTSQNVKFWIVYPDRSETPARIAKHMADYQLPGFGISDRDNQLKRRSDATVSPQAAVFDSNGKLVYSGRIDDRFITFGKSRSTATVHNLEDAIQATLSNKPIALSRTKAIGCYLDDLK